MATSQYTYQPYHTIGAAMLLLWDESAGGGNGAWQSIGKVADAALNVATEQVAKEIVTRGLSQRNRSKRYSLSFRMLENANPQVLSLVLSDGAAQVVGLAGEVTTDEVVQLFGEDYTELSHPYGLVSGSPPVLKSYDGLTTYVLDTDYESSPSKGLLKRKSGGSIPSGAKLYVSYTYNQPTGVSTGIGDTADLERYRKVKLLQLDVEGSGPADWIEAGLEFEFHRVNVNGADTTIPFSEDDFSEGASVSWDCLYSSADAGVGTVRSSYGELAAY